MMSLRRSLLPTTRSSRFALNRDGAVVTVKQTGAVTHRVFSTSSGYKRRSVSTAAAAAASAFGLSLVAYYALVVNPVHADRPVDGLQARLQALRTRKSVESFALGAKKDTEARLKQFEETHEPPSTSGIARYDIAQVESNEPTEDDHAEAFINSGDSRWSFFTVLDGHSGWETSATLKEELIDSVLTEFAAIDSEKDDDSDAFAEAISRAFTTLDDKIVHKSLDQVFKTKSRALATDVLAPAYAGACALLAFYDASTSLLRVALTGDCRAVLGRKRPDGKFDLEVLTIDQNGFDPDEKRRAEEAHPGEEVVKNGRVMGFGPSRVFGDARYKWSREVQDRLWKDYLGRQVRDTIKTPPYFSAEPVIKTTNVKPGDFIVLATDGLWDCLSNQEVVGLVGEWVHKREGRKKSWRNMWWGQGATTVASLPVVYDTTKDVDKSENYGGWHAQKKFLTVDANAATHLIRNALGGDNEDLGEALLSMRSPRARSYWDDITATVVFFGEHH